MMLDQNQVANVGRVRTLLAALTIALVAGTVGPAAIETASAYTKIGSVSFANSNPQWTYAQGWPDYTYTIKNFNYMYAQADVRGFVPTQETEGAGLMIQGARFTYSGKKGQAMDFRFSGGAVRTNLSCSALIGAGLATLSIEVLVYDADWLNRNGTKGRDVAKQLITKASLPCSTFVNVGAEVELSPDGPSAKIQFSSTAVVNDVWAAAATMKGVRIRVPGSYMVPGHRYYLRVRAAVSAAHRGQANAKSVLEVRSLAAIVTQG